MSFVADNAQGTGGGNPEGYLFPVPKTGNRRGRISLIVDLGIQNREPVWEKDGKLVKTGESTEGAVAKEQKPVRQVAVFADLVNDLVDYGGDIGEAHYRMMINKVFKGDVKGITFQKAPPAVDGGEWGIHPKNVLSEIAKAVGKSEVITSTDISKLLGEQLMVQVKVTEKDAGKNDKDGNPIIYRNVNFEKVSQVAAEIKEVDGEEVEVIPTFAKLKMDAKCVTFANATKEDIKFIRANVLKLIKEANDYEGSNMQKAVEAYEAEKAAAKGEDAAKPAAKPKAKPAPKPKAPVEQDDDSDVPF